MNVDLLNLRHGPGEKYKVLEVLKRDLKIQILGSTLENWFLIETNEGSKGWILKNKRAFGRL